MNYQTRYKKNPETGKYDIPYLTFTRSWPGTKDTYSQITKEEYEEYSKMPPGELSEKIREGLDASIICGYGFYGTELFHDSENDLYFLGISTGTSCD